MVFTFIVKKSVNEFIAVVAIVVVVVVIVVILILKSGADCIII